MNDFFNIRSLKYLYSHRYGNILCEEYVERGNLYTTVWGIFGIISVNKTNCAYDLENKFIEADTDLWYI